MARLDPTGVSRILTYIKTWITGLLNDKANSSHTHTKSQITDFPTIPSKTSQLTNDSGFLTAHQSLSNYSTLANTVKSISISGKTITVTPGSGSAYTLTTQDTVYTHPTTAGNKHIPSGGSANQYLKYSASGTAVWANLPTIPSNTNQLTNGAGYITSSGSCASCTTAGQVSTSVAAGSTKALVYSSMADNDQFRILVGGASNAGYVEIATSDDGNEPIYVRQYNNGTFGKVVRTLTLLDGSGNTQFPGTVTATTFSGNVTGNCSGSSGSCTGNAATATKATYNANGKELVNSIIKGLSVSGRTITYTKLDGTTSTLTTQDTNTTYSNFVKSGSGAKAGLVPAPSTTAGTTKYLREDGTWQVPPDHTYTVNNATLTIQKNGTNVATFTSNASSNVTCNITVPTKTSELTNNSGFLTSHQSLSGYVPRSGGNVMTGSSLGRSVSTNRFDIYGGAGWNNGGTIVLTGASYSEAPGIVKFYPCKNASINSDMWLNPDGTWTWTGQPCQTSSDQRLKQQIAEIDDKLLDAWEDVLPCQFKYNDAVDQKGDTARLHTGYVVQQIDEACKSHNVDISAYGLYCHEEYPERTEEVEVEQDDGSVIKETKVLEPAKEYYSLRYTEALIVECAYLRREVKRLSERLEKLEK